MNRIELVGILEEIIGATDNKTDSLIGTDSFIFDENNIYTYSDRLFFTCPLTSGLSCSVKANETLKILKKMTGDNISLSIEKERLIIKDDKTTLKLHLVQADKKIIDIISSIDKNSLGWKKLPDDFIDGIKMCSLAMYRDDESSHHNNMNGIVIHDNNAISTDNFRIGMYTYKKKIDNMTIPSFVVNILLKIKQKPTKYRLLNGTTLILYENNMIMAINPVENIFEEKIVEIIQNNLKLLKGKNLFLFPKDMINDINIVSIMASDTENVSMPTISFVKEKNYLIIRGQKESIGEITRKIEIDNNQSSFPDNTIIYINPDFLKTIIDITNEFYFIDNAIIFKTDNLVYMISIFAEKSNK